MAKVCKPCKPVLFVIKAVLKKGKNKQYILSATNVHLFCFFNLLVQSSISVHFFQYIYLLTNFVSLVPTIYFGDPEMYVDESDGYVEVLVWRAGTDLSKTSTVSVQSRPSDPLSAECKP